MNALRLFSGIALVVASQASLYPASTSPFTHTLGHHAHASVVAPYALNNYHAVAPAVHSAAVHSVAPAVHAVAPAVHTAAVHAVAPAVHAVAPAVQTTQHHSQDEYGQYEFGYSGGPSSRHETGDAYGNVRGSYSYVDAYGQVQSQSYVADDYGFRVVGTNLPTAPGHHHLGKRSASYPASTGHVAVAHHAHPVAHVSHTAHHAVAPVAHVSHATHVAPVVHAGHHVAHAAHHVAPVVHAGHHVAHAVPVAHSHDATHYTIPGAHVSHVATHNSNGYGYGHNNGAFSYRVSAAAPVYGYAQNHYAHAGHY